MTPEQIFSSQYISYSRLSSYAQCPQRFKLEYLNGLPCPVGPKAQLGTVVHAIIAEHLRALMDLGGRHDIEVADFQPLIVPTCRDLRAGGEITAWIEEEDIMDMLKGLASVLPSIDTRAVAGIELEKQFTINGYRCRAILDLVLRRKDGLVTIIDFKTGKPKYVKDLQLKFYALPYLGSTGTKVRASFAFLRTGKISTLPPMNHSMALDVANLVMAQVRSIEEDDSFHGEPGPLCRFCGVREHCSYF